MSCRPQVPVNARGRASRSNDSSRYEAFTRAEFNDGWEVDDDAPAQRATSLTAETARTIISRNQSPDIGFDRSINPYRGCEHGCIYCYARPTHAYLGLSPGLDFETKLFFKPEAAHLLERELSRRSYQPARIQLGANTDPYQPIERKLKVTRAILEVLARYRHPVTITTKSALVTRDIDILAPMAALRLAAVSVSVTSLDRKLARAMEPRASTPERRLEAIRQLSAAGVPTIIGFAPIIPGLNDHELEAVLAKGADAGALCAHFTVLRLPLEIKDLFREWLEAERPDRAVRVMSLVRQMRNGRDYDPEWGKRMRGEGPVADMLATRFRLAVRKLGLDRRVPALDIGLFVRPSGDPNQMELFG
ncbi:MAG TPA: PA0069 family radical SAM protein [Caulobacteraceae bacterium]|nr:PA0069 family radical SAM protein [Caulobacteraceae bacterium]